MSNWERGLNLHNMQMFNRAMHWTPDTITRGPRFIEFSVSMRVFWYVTRLYLKKYMFKTLLHAGGSQTLKSDYSWNIRLRKKIRSVLKSHGPGLSNAHRNRKVPYPSVHYRVTYKNIKLLYYNPWSIIMDCIILRDISVKINPIHRVIYVIL